MKFIASIGPLSIVLDWCTKTSQAKAEAHEAFDPLWQSGEMSRNAAYRWLAAQLGITREECHMSLFDEAMCRKVIAVCESRPAE